MKSQEKANCGENIGDAYRAREQNQEINIEDTGINLEPGKPEMEYKHRNVVFQDYKKQQNDKIKDPTDNVKIPDRENRSSCMSKYICYAILAKYKEEDAT